MGRVEDSGGIVGIVGKSGGAVGGGWETKLVNQYNIHVHSSFFIHCIVHATVLVVWFLLCVIDCNRNGGFGGLGAVGN